MFFRRAYTLLYFGCFMQLFGRRLWYSEKRELRPDLWKRWNKRGRSIRRRKNFPDDVLRNWIKNGENLNGAGSDGFLSYEETGNIKDITIRGTSDNSIKDLKGVEFFTELTSLSVPYNSITSLDLKYNNKITYLNCSYNKLENINIRGLDSLISFNCEFNYLKSLDLSDNVSLTVLYCRHNLLENLALSNNTELVFIETFDNMLTEIDVSMLEKL